MITAKEKVATFEHELSLIFDESIREFTRLCLIAAPDYFFEDCPASTSGKYHPIGELGPDGTIIHTRKIVVLAYELSRGLNCEESRDEIVSACIIHDLLKQGETKSGHTVKYHPDLAAKLVQRVQNETGILTDKSLTIIKNSVGFHYGPWSMNPWLKSMKEYTLEELCVYLSDYVASKRFVEISYRR